MKDGEGKDHLRERIPSDEVNLPPSSVLRRLRRVDFWRAEEGERRRVARRRSTTITGEVGGLMAKEGGRRRRKKVREMNAID